MNTRRVATTVLLTIAITMSLGLAPGAASADPPPPHPTLQASITLQVPGLVWGIGGAAIAQPRVFYGHGQIYPYPVGYGYRYHWHNLTTGAAGTIYDYPHRRSTIRTGAGQIVVSGEFYPQPNVYVSTPAAGAFYVTQ